MCFTETAAKRASEGIFFSSKKAVFPCVIHLNRIFLLLSCYCSVRFLFHEGKVHLLRIEIDREKDFLPLPSPLSFLPSLSPFANFRQGSPGNSFEVVSCRLHRRKGKNVIPFTYDAEEKLKKKHNTLWDVRSNGREAFFVVLQSSSRYTNIEWPASFSPLPNPHVIPYITKREIEKAQVSQIRRQRAAVGEPGSYYKREREKDAYGESGVFQSCR